MNYFVWRRFNGEVWAERWHYNFRDKERLGVIIFKKALEGEDLDLSITELAEKYPAPQDAPPSS